MSLIGFKTTIDRKYCIFIQFDIERFYPSITKQLMLKAIEQAKLYPVSLISNLISSCTPENPHGFPKIKPDRKQLMNPYLM